GPLWDAIRASCAIPGLFTPHEEHRGALVDGGLLAPLPIAATRMSDAHRMIAVERHGWPERPPGSAAGAPAAADEDHGVGRAASVRDRMAECFERRPRLRSDETGQNGLSELLSRALDPM